MTQSKYLKQRNYFLNAHTDASVSMTHLHMGFFFILLSLIFEDEFIFGNSEKILMSNDWILTISPVVCKIPSIT